MDFNPDASKHLDPSVQFLEQDCASHWQMDNDCLNVVFSSNFFEHLPSKAMLGRTLDEIFRCLAPDGKLIAMGPNIKYLPGEYWDFWDHYLPLTESSLIEGLTNRGFEIVQYLDKFLPYTMVKTRQYSQLALKLYLKFSGGLADFRKAVLDYCDKTGSTLAAFLPKEPERRTEVNARHQPGTPMLKW